GSVSLELGGTSDSDEPAAEQQPGGGGPQHEELRINCPQGLKEHIVRFLDAQSQRDPAAMPTWQLTPQRPQRPGAPDHHSHHPHGLTSCLPALPQPHSQPPFAAAASTSAAAAEAGYSGGGKVSGHELIS
ncbi:hypothetical protein Agub_g9856, partial [Astrephomene gubernaculifera]